jgi:hypothetical protein
MRAPRPKEVRVWVCRDCAKKLNADDNQEHITIGMLIGPDVCDMCHCHTGDCSKLSCFRSFE